MADKTQRQEHTPVAAVCVGFVFNDQPIIESSELFAGFRSLIIRHDEQEYSLETTRNGKLILKK